MPVRQIEKAQFGYNFIQGDEYRFREVVGGDDSAYRALTESEIIVLESLGNRSDNWANVLVKRGCFNARALSFNRFYGKVRIGQVSEACLQYHDLVLPEGISHSTIISCDIGDHCAIHRVRYLSHYIVGARCMLHSIDEMQTTNHAKFGNGIVKEGEDEDVLVQVAVINENQGREVAPFEDLIGFDAALWACNRDDVALMKAFRKLTDDSYSLKRGWYGTVGEASVIKGCKIIKDVAFGTECYVKGCNKLKNLTVKDGAQLGEGIELVNGIVGYGCTAFYGCKAVRFVMGERSNLKYGARLINSILGDNSTVSCCEVLSNLVYPFHEQHHNNSFLIASLIKGQSNMAAGANIGSNHNSRGADGEMIGGRGFWPALSSTIKYNSYFASFTLIAKGDYPYEINLRLPFSLLSDNPTTGHRELMPGYWWMYNLYAMERNQSKFKSRDKRKYGLQHIETAYLAPDTASEIIEALGLLARWSSKSLGVSEKEARNILLHHPELLSGKVVNAEGLENSNKPVRILKVSESYKAYLQMLIYYCVREICTYCKDSGLSVSSLVSSLGSSCASLERYGSWENMGGQLVPSFRLEELKAQIKEGYFATWKDVHAAYDALWALYPQDKACNALWVLSKLFDHSLNLALWETLVKEFKKIIAYIESQVRITKQKDYENPFRMCTYKSTQERDAIVGKSNENEFVNQSNLQSQQLLSLVSSVFF